MKKICLLFLTVLSILLSSCRQDTTQLAKDEFSKYYNGKDEVALIHNCIICFENHTLDLDSLVEDNDFNLGLTINRDGFVFSTSEQISLFNFAFNIYESNFQGTDIKLLYSKDGFKTYPWVYAIDGVFYIEHYSNNAFDLESKLIDKYTISTGIYENIASGKDCYPSDYKREEEQTRYSIEVIENISPQEHGKFIITDLESGIVRTIDDAFLKDTIYIESMEKFNYSPMRVDISNGHILLTYSIGAGDGWNNPHLIFEYDFDLNTIEYKLLAFPDESESHIIDIVYIG